VSRSPRCPEGGARIDADYTKGGREAKNFKSISR
jgi:hypothetical protein